MKDGIMVHVTVDNNVFNNAFNNVANHQVKAKGVS